MEPLIDLYQPNVVIRMSGGEVALSWRHHDQVDLHPELAVLLSTSGSTGTPKLVKLSRRNRAGYSTDADSPIRRTRLDAGAGPLTSI